MSTPSNRRKGAGANKYTAYTYVTDTHKRCSLCEEIKLHEDFHRDKKNKHTKGLAYYCKRCANRKARENHRLRFDTIEQYRIDKRISYIKSEYGISIEEYEAKLKSQDYNCSICKADLRKHNKFCHLDHDHNTGKLREFLCSNCNRGLGSFMDSMTLLKIAAMYLEKHSALDKMQKEGSGP